VFRVHGEVNKLVLQGPNSAFRPSQLLQQLRLVGLCKFAPQSVHIALLLFEHEPQRMYALELQLPQFLVLEHGTTTLSNHKTTQNIQ
jgi:hypothetical protein